VLKSVVQYILDNRVGDWASIIGLLVSLVGFVATLVNVRRSRSAADQARLAAQETRRDISKSNMLGTLAAAMLAMEEIKRVHRRKVWDILPDRYSELKKALISVKGANLGLSVAQTTAIQNAVQHLANFERLVERALANNTEPDVAKINGILSDQVASLQEILVFVQNGIGR
jgi:hypothetical protein